MDFFKELLESFSRVHGRELRLLEGFEERSSDAAEVINKAFPKIATGMKAMDVGVNKLEVNIGRPAGGSNLSISIPGVRASISVSPEGQLIGNKQGIKSAHTRLLGKEEDAAPSNNQNIQSPPPIQLTYAQQKMQELGMDDPFLADKVDTLLRRLENKIGWAGGRRAKDILNALFKSAPSLTLMEDGSLQASEGELNADSISEIVSTLSNMVGGESNFRCSDMQETTEGTVVVAAANADPNGSVVFNSKDISKTLKQIYKKSTGDKCPGGPPGGVTLFEAAQTRGESNIRGNLFEPISDLFTLHKRFREVDGTLLLSPSERKKSIGMMHVLYNKARAAIESLNEARETWIPMAQDAAVPIEEQIQYEGLVELLGVNKAGPWKQPDPTLLKALYTATRVQHTMREPYLTLRVGDQVGGGQKQDSIELYTNQAQLQRALDRSFGDRSPKPSARGQKRTAVEIFGEQKLQDYIDSGHVAHRDQEFWVSEVSLKNLLSGNTVIQGVTTVGAMGDFMTGGGGQAAFKSNFDRKTGNLLTPGTDSKIAFDELVAKEQTIRTNVNNTAYNNTTRGAGGGQVVVNTMEVAIDGALASFSNLSVSELDANPQYQALLQLKADYSTVANDDRAKRRYINDARKALYAVQIKNSIQTDVNTILNDAKSSPARKQGAMLYAAAIPFKAGASISDETVMGINTLKERMSYIATQNAAYNEIIEEVVSGDPNKPEKWELIAGDSIRWRKVGNPNESVNTSFDGKQWKSTKSWSYVKNNSTVHSFDDPELARQDTSTALPSLSSLQESIELLLEKVRILNSQ